MIPSPIQDESVGDAIWPPIKTFKEAGLNIIESPSAGYIKVSTNIHALIRVAVDVMLQGSLNRGSGHVRVMCTIDHRRVLELRVADDGDEFCVPDQIPLSTIGEWAGEFGGILGLDHEPSMAAWLTIPLSG